MNHRTLWGLEWTWHYWRLVLHRSSRTKFLQVGPLTIFYFGR